MQDYLLPFLARSADNLLKIGLYKSLMEKLLNVDFLTRSCGERILLGAVCIETLTELHPKWRTLERLVVCPLDVRHLTRNRTQTKLLSNTYKLYHANNLIKLHVNQIDINQRPTIFMLGSV